MGNTSIAVLGVAYDAKADKVFWFDYEPGLEEGPYRVYSADLSGNGVQLLLSKSILVLCHFKKKILLMLFAQCLTILM